MHIIFGEVIYTPFYRFMATRMDATDDTGSRETGLEDLLLPLPPAASGRKGRKISCSRTVSERSSQDPGKKTLKNCEFLIFFAREENLEKIVNFWFFSPGKKILKKLWIFDFFAREENLEKIANFWFFSPGKKTLKKFCYFFVIFFATFFTLFFFVLFFF